MSTDNCPAWEYGTCTCKVECPDDRTERTAAEERADRVTRLRRRAEYWDFKAALRDAADRIRERRPPAMSSDHCQHCDEGCRVGPDPEYHAATSAVGYIWFAGEGCPVCRNVALLRQMASDGEAQVKQLAKASAEAMMRGEPLESLPEYEESVVIVAGVLTLRRAADRIEADR